MNKPGSIPALPQQEEPAKLSPTAYTLGRSHTCYKCEYSNIPCPENRRAAPTAPLLPQQEETAKPFSEELIAKFDDWIQAKPDSFQLAAYQSAFHEVLGDLVVDDAKFQAVRVRYIYEAIRDNEIIESSLVEFLKSEPVATPQGAMDLIPQIKHIQGLVNDESSQQVVLAALEDLLKSAYRIEPIAPLLGQDEPANWPTPRFINADATREEVLLDRSKWVKYTSNLRSSLTQALTSLASAQNTIKELEQTFGLPDENDPLCAELVVSGTFKPRDANEPRIDGTIGGWMKRAEIAEASLAEAQKRIELAAQDRAKKLEEELANLRGEINGQGPV